jgi:hypothetical protein
MVISTEAVRGNIRLSYANDIDNDDDKWSYTVSRLNAEADASSLLLLAEAVSELQGGVPLDLINRSEFRLISE